VVVELLVIIGLVVWAVTRPSAPAPDTTAVVSPSDGAITASLFATGLDTPTAIATTPAKDDTRLFVTERGGAIQIVKNGKLEAAPFLDIKTKVKDDGAEMGLLGLTFHPNYATNNFFYVNYIDKQDNTVVARYTATSVNQADPASEKVLLKIKQPYPNHNGGAVEFGPDGFLYIATGDGGSGGDPENRAQNKAELLGKLLRIDVDKGDPYAIPADNPFANEAGTKPEIWAWGLRNPWRISFDKETGDLYIADVGQGDIEEVNLQKATSRGGENYGWRCYEGTKAFNTNGCKEANTYTTPQFEYIHEKGRCSITGGYLYHGSRNPSLENMYVYGDLCSGEVFSAEQKDGAWTQKVILDTPYTISTFGQDQSGELYVADLNSGTIYRLETN
jgi:glucose/arabinose dehydrogenase